MLLMLYKIKALKCGLDGIIALGFAYITLKAMPLMLYFSYYYIATPIM